ncbi:MAG: asparaginyl-tRNA synthetase [Candidatus Phytoplasma cynodontis]|uniref:asparagine--tRNA ligase n=1 Tax='Cynodon dactylon' phytoplasma TaxID=295320 RepID=UPI001265B802|nr:asparagine--tRNA ligase ['Cynodon dactylon' phytoplasma]KAB8121716.1 asparagine--tRNA ligase ['Cynodon dactylon' phytoplasma]WIA07701.1 MAG: asparaginyl-tRNA synthetase [Candidatus Phytoplasma cynodontis]
MKKFYSIKNINDNYNDLIENSKKICVNGWIKNCRFQKKIFFININDGSFIDDLQVVLKERENIKLNSIKEYLQIGAAISIKGFLVRTKKKKQPFELLFSEINFFNKNLDSYPIQPKKHSNIFLRQLPHLRMRTKLFGAIFRIRNIATCAINNFFQKEGFIQVHTPIITTSDGEGAGELFKVTTFDFEKIPINTNKKIDFKKDFFEKPTFLTVTGQLEAEAFAMAFSKVYTFGPTFRAENSNTVKHISEFWMIEPEMAFFDLQDNILIAQNMIKYVIQFCLNKNRLDFEFLEKTLGNDLINRLEYISSLKEFPQIKYIDAINILKNSQVKFEIDPCYGKDLSSEHEKFLTDVFFKKPIFVIDWPKEIKAFYMKNNDDNKTVAAMDLLVPKIGELIGGSQREEKLEILEEKIKIFNIDKEELEWYLDLRRFGSCIHSGFGLGFERFLLFLTGLENIRDVIAFPRSSKNISSHYKKKYKIMK